MTSRNHSYCGHGNVFGIIGLFVNDPLLCLTAHHIPISLIPLQVLPPPASLLSPSPYLASSCTSFLRDCDEFVDAIGPDRPFLGGSQPNLADLAAYGVLKAVERTPTFEDAMKGSPKARAWYARVAEAIGPSSRVSTEGSAWSLAAKS